MKLRALWLALLISVLGCAGGPPTKPPTVDPTEQWISAGKKVEFAITQTKTMIQRARGTAYLPDLYMRLGELYTERARYAWLVVYERRKARGDEAKAVEAPEARLLKNLAISTYSRVIREFPTYARDDEALFFTGHEYRELGDFDKMKESYEQLVENYPKSTHRLEAFLALGDHAFDASDLATAQRYYERILAEPASAVHPLARYKLAWVKVNQGDCRDAVRLFEITLKDHPPSGATAGLSAALLRTQKNLNVAREALIDLAYCYPDIYPDKPPAPYFRELASASSDYIAAMRRLASRYSVKEMRPQESVALREVLDGSPGDEDGVELVRRLHAAVTKANVYDKPAEDVGRVISALDTKLSDYRFSADAGKKLFDEMELYARDIATRAQVIAKDGGNPAVNGAVADAYAVYLSRFGKTAAADDIRENYAETLLTAKRYYEAGRAYEQVAAASKKGASPKQARLNAIAAYQQALESPQLGRLHRLIAWNGVRAMGSLVIAEAPSDPAVLGIKLSIARSRYETGDYEASAKLFYAVAHQYPTTNEGVAAAHLSLDALRLADNLEELTTVGGWLVADTRIREDVRKELSEIVSKAAQRQVEEVTASDSDDREQQLLALAKSHKGSEVGEEAFYNTLLLARSNGELERFYELGDQFLADYPSSQRRTNVLGALAGVASDSAAFKQEAKYMAAAFAADPQGKDSADRLYSAASIHAVLGDPAVASEISKLSDRGSSKVDDLLVLLARSGHVSLLDQVLNASPINTPTAGFFRGYSAFAHGDYAGASAALSRKSATSADLSGRAKFLLGEIAYAEFKAAGTKGGELAENVDRNVKALANVDRAFKPVIEGGDARWAMAGLARVADANMKFAAVLREIELPASLSDADKQALKGALEGQAAAAEKRGGELRGACAKQAKKAEIFSEAAKSCLLGQPLADTITMYRDVRATTSGEPAGAAAFQKALLKNSRDVDAMTKLAQLYLTAGDAGVALLLLERAEQVGTHRGAVQNLLGLTHYQLDDAQGAAEAFKAAVAAEPSDPHWHLNLAAHCAAFGHMDRAKSELAKSGSLLNEPRGPTDHPDVGLLSQIGPAPAAKGKAR
jgi:tetratricopeptide (TPR) repeat protein/thioredoxin-like negative regulator of GroEL